MAGLLELIEKNLNKGLKTGVFLLPYSMGGMVDTLHRDAKVLRTDYTADGIEVEATCDEVLYGKLSQYLK